MKIRFCFSFFLSLCLLVFSAKAEIVLIQNGFSKMALGRYIKVLETKGKPSLLKVKRDSIQYPFKNNYLEFLNLPTSESDKGYWLKIEIHNVSDERKQLIIEFENPLLREVEFFEIQEGKIIENKYTGSRFEYATRKEENNTFLFRTRLLPQESKEYYFYISQQGQSLLLPVHLYTTESFYARLSLVQANVWLAVGALLMLSMVLWWFAGKFWNDFFAALALYVSSWVMLVLIYSGHSYPLLWQSAYYWNSWSVDIFQALNALFVVRMGYIFWRSYTLIPQALRVFNILIYTSFALLGILLLVMYFEILLPPFLHQHLSTFWCVCMNVLVWLLLVCWEISVSKRIWNIVIFVSSILLGILLGILIYKNPTVHYFYTEPVWLATITGFNLYMAWLAMRRVHFVQNERKLDQWISIQRIRNTRTNPE
ncbi:MAG: hypothetical protein EAZ95_08440 [Bacteroidetes bacterium]|nr:MAG: hypothetical protein EAZ95_08440 [Bacteroidota bacterium]